MKKMVTRKNLSDTNPKMKYETEPNAATDCGLLIRSVVESFTNNHSQIELTQIPILNGAGVRFILRVHKAEHSKVVGKQGRHIKALQTIVEAAGRQNENSFLLALDEPRFGEKTPSPASADWNAPSVEKVLGETMRMIGGGMVEASDTQGCTHYDCEGRSLRPEIQEAVRTIFSAIGHSHGRTVEFNFI